MSTSHSRRTEKYEAMKEADSHLQRCGLCGKSGAKHLMDRHHINGRWGDNIFNYRYYCRPCHRWIHQNPKLAIEQGHLHSRDK